MPINYVDIKNQLGAARICWGMLSLPLSCSSTSHCAHIFPWDAAFPGFHVRIFCASICGFWDNFFFMLPFWVWETETQTTAVPVYTKWICFNLIVCLIYWSFSCNTCKAQPHIISWQARKNPVGKRVSFFSPSLFSSFFGAAKLLFSKDAKNFSAPTMSLVCLALRCEDFHTVYNLVLFNNSFTGLFSCASWRLWTARKNSQQVSVCLLFATHICAWKWEGKLGWVIESL